MAGVYTVKQVNSYIKNMFKQDFLLNSVSVKGEISNCKYHTSGHIYFTLKDSGGTIAVVMFASYASKLDIKLENGMSVVGDGRIDIYERDGRYQLYAVNITESGMGDLYKKFEQLKQQYDDMGYFDSSYKRPIPRFARKIGIVTASTGAAIHDIMNISHRRNPYVSLYLYPALVQGEYAKYSIAKGIAVLDKFGVDCIIVGRGGGSLEDLWAFNDEELAYAVYHCKTPVISGVGHETDFTICDFVADKRASTPSAAAELAVPDRQELISYYKKQRQYLAATLEQKFKTAQLKLEKQQRRMSLSSPKVRAEQTERQLLAKAEKISRLMNDNISRKENKLVSAKAKLDGLNPLNVLGRGYAIAEKDEKIITSAKQLSGGDEFTVILSDGKINAKVCGD